MKLILDNNSLFSIMNPKSVSAYLFSSIKAKFIAPEFIKSEFDEHKEECLYKSKLSEHEFDIRRSEIEGSIEFLKESVYKFLLKKAVVAISDEEDSPYLALALSRNAAIWSDDPHLKKQSLVSVYTTAELLDMLLKNEI
ncbi:MAG: PIN domain-containing protein [Nanoarchaeota archaeon]